MFEDFLGITEVPALKDYRIIALDFPGCGDTPYPLDTHMNVDELVEITSAVLSGLRATPCILIGHSMGGLVALLYIVKYSQHIDAFISVEGNVASFFLDSQSSWE